MGIMDLARRDARKIATDSDGFAEEVKLIHPSGDELIVNALTTIHHTSFDPDSGSIVNTLNGSICVSETDLIEGNYVYLNAAGEVQFYKHKVDVTQANGTTKRYMIQQWFPDKRLGLIVLILQDYKQNV